MAVVSLSQRLRKALGPEEYSEGTESLAEDEPVDVVPETPACTKKVSEMQR